MGFTAVTSLTSPRQYFTEGAAAVSRSGLCRSAVPLTHCWMKGGVQIAEQLTVLCDLIQPCPGRFIRWGLSLPRCAVMKCPFLRSRWSRTNDAGLAFHAKASARISGMNSAHLLQQFTGCQTGFIWHFRVWVRIICCPIIYQCVSLTKTTFTSPSINLCSNQ